MTGGFAGGAPLDLRRGACHHGSMSDGLGDCCAAREIHAICKRPLILSHDCSWHRALPWTFPLAAPMRELMCTANQRR